MKRLTTGQERELVIAADGGDPDACRDLIEAFLPAVVAVARRFPTGAGIEREELIQDGVAGLLFATHRYDPRLGTPFWAYASFWVRKAMQELVAELTRPIASPIAPPAPSRRSTGRAASTSRRTIASRPTSS